jgi:hypothetical protein
MRGIKQDLAVAQIFTPLVSIRFPEPIDNRGMALDGELFGLWYWHGLSHP